MGGQSSKIDTSSVPIEQIRASSSIQQNKFCPPFRKFKNQQIQISDRTLKATVDIEQPNREQITITQQYYSDLQDAFDCKTKDIQLQTVLKDDYYSDIKTYIGRQNGKDITIQIKPFSKYNTYIFNSILYQIHMNEQIQKLNSVNLNTIQNKYIIQTGLDIQGQQYSNSQIYKLSSIATNLSQIIKYRRQNKWGWSTNQFNLLANDLVNALIVLHNAKITHNDIRPCNVYYSLEKKCYQLSCFANAVKIGNNDNNSNNINNVRASVYYGAPQLSTMNIKDNNLQQADVYSLGMTLLSAFYLCEPIDRKSITQYNKKYTNYSVMQVIKQMIMPIDKRINLNIISKKIPKGQNSTKMYDFMQSLKYRNSPKQQQLIKTKKLLSDGYQRLGLWNDWKDQNYQAYSLEQNTLDDYKKANSLAGLAKIQSCRGDLQSSSQYAKSASKIYRNLGYTAYEHGNMNQSMNLFTKAIQCSKYYQNKYDIDYAKNLQGLSLIHAQKGDYQVSKPLIKQASSIVIKNTNKDSIDYCKIKMSQAKIETDYGQFDTADKILNQCLSIAENKVKYNQQLGFKLKAQILHQLGRTSMLKSSYDQNNQQLLIGAAQKYIADSIAINQQFPDNHIALANNIQTFGQIQLRKQNYEAAKSNFNKSSQIRQTYIKQSKDKDNNNISISIQKQKADTLCNLAACQTGLDNNTQALRYYNQALQIYRHLYGSDHNKFSAMAIGNMSKVYYKINQKSKAKDCLKIATNILGDLLGQDDPDYKHFRQLDQTI